MTEYQYAGAFESAILTVHMIGVLAAGLLGRLDLTGWAALLTWVSIIRIRSNGSTSEFVVSLILLYGVPGLIFLGSIISVRAGAAVLTGWLAIDMAHSTITALSLICGAAVIAVFRSWIAIGTMSGRRRVDEWKRTRTETEEAYFVSFTHQGVFPVDADALTVSPIPTSAADTVPTVDADGVYTAPNAIRSGETITLRYDREEYDRSPMVDLNYNRNNITYFSKSQEEIEEELEEMRP